MANGSNICILLGNLGGDPELKTTQGGKSFLKFSLATSESWKDQSGQKQEKTEWHSCTLWGPRAEGLQRILGKGDRVQVVGSIRYSSYEKDGEKRYRTDIEVRDVTLCGGGKRGEDGERAQSRAVRNSDGSVEPPADYQLPGDAEPLPF